MGESDLLELVGCVERIIYRNEKNGYTVLDLSTEDEMTTAVGIMPWTSVGEEVRLIGKWKKHTNFGLQFDVKVCERIVPSTTKAILKYLSSGAIKGIGPKTALKLVEKFGDDTLNIMQNEPERLQSISGITKAKANKIADELKNVFGIKELMISLSQFGITPEESLAIFKVWGDKSVDIIRENPYCICEEPISISFDRADIIANLLDFPIDNVFRTRAAIVYIIKHNVKNGYTCIPQDKLLKAATSFLEISEEHIEQVLEDLKVDKTIECDVINDRDFVFLPDMYECELYIAKRLRMMLRFPPQSIIGIENEIKSIEIQNGIKYADMQKKAIRDALEKGILVLTGGPGTGKTTTLNAIIKILESKGEKVLLAAPTGRAAQRMSDLTGKEAKTIHRLLEVQWDESDKPMFKKNEKDLLNCDAIILDEVSMVDVKLFEGVLRALPLGCRLIMVGDTDQLPAVGAGNVLGDIINSGVLPVVALKEIFRQSLKSLIITNAHKIVRGEVPELTVRDNDFFFIDRTNAFNIGDTIVDLYKTRLPKTYGYSPLFDIQVLCPTRKGDLGTNSLNQRIQREVNPYSEKKKEILINGIVFRENDKVMQTKNNYDIPWTRDDSTGGEGIFNGDIGILIDVDVITKTLVVQFDNKLAVYDTDAATDLELAYAITVHKGQGSEFEAVIMPMLYGTPQLYYRNLLYTAVTRAKSIIIMVGTKSTVYKMVENDKKTKRFSSLCHFLTRGE